MPPKPKPEDCVYGEDPATVAHTFVASTTGVLDKDSGEEETDAVAVTFCSRCGVIREVRSVTLT